MKPDSIPEAFRYDEKLDRYDIDMVPDEEDGLFRTLNDKLGRNITLSMIDVADAEKMQSGDLHALRKYIRLGRTGTMILTSGYMIEDRTGRKIGITKSVVKEYPAFKKPRRKKIN